jgi:DNA-binding LytR/AlgR family response regulator
MLTDAPVAERRAATSPVRVIGGGRVSICSRASTEVVEWGDIILARSDRSYTWIVTRRGALRVRGPLHVVICSLAGLGFVQIHRGVAVNDSKVRRLIRSGRRRLDILLEDDMRLEVGRQFQRSVRDRFGAERREPSPPTSRWAFEGKLVDQDSRDESAEKLLTRIGRDAQPSATTPCP